MTSKKSLILYIVSILSLALFFSYSLVFAVPIKNKDFVFSSSSKNIFLNSLDLNSNKVITNKYFSDYTISGDCSAYGKLLGKEGDYSVFDIKLLDTDCDKKQVNVKFELDSSVIDQKFNVISSYDLYSNILDKSSFSIKTLVNSLENKIASEKKDDYKSIRSKEEIMYLKDFLQNIINKRQEKYKIPVLGVSLPKAKNKIPNTARPYRETYTDGIHHGWDFDADKGDSVISLDDGVVIKVVNNFLFSDLGNIDKSSNLTEEQKLKNLDILRGNQVWVKTMKGDVAFYSHLDEVFEDIKVGSVVSKGQPLGTIGITGVPDKNYSDYHLHIPVHKNPYLESKAGKYTEMDYMKWDWYFKGETLDYVLENQENIFEK